MKRKGCGPASGSFTVITHQTFLVSVDALQMNPLLFSCVSPVCRGHCTQESGHGLCPGMSFLMQDAAFWSDFFHPPTLPAAPCH